MATQPAGQDHVGEAGDARERGPEGAPSPESAEQETLRELVAIGDNLLGVVREGVEVVRSEARLFVSSLTLLAVLAVMAGMLLAGAWLCIIAAVALLLVALGLAPWLAALATGAGLIAAGYAIFLWIRGLIKDLSFLRSREVLSELRTGEPGEERQ